MHTSRELLTARLFARFFSFMLLICAAQAHALTVTTGFDVRQHGFSFDNQDWGKICYSITGATKLRYDPGGTFCSAGWGLCGGMSLYAGERFISGMKSHHLSKEEAKPAIVDDQFRTLDSTTVAKFLEWISSPDKGHPWNPKHSVRERTKNDWDNSIRPRLERREPVVLGLIFDKRATLSSLLEVGALADLTNQHQVLAIGFTQNGDDVEIQAYDPNYHDDVLLLRFTRGKYGITQRLSSNRPLGDSRRTPRGIMFVRSVSVIPHLEVRTKAAQAPDDWTARSESFEDGPGVLEGYSFVGDVDGDGRNDLVYVFYNDWAVQKGLEIRTKISNGNGTWNSKGQVLSDGSGVLHGKFFLGDVNGDGKADLVYVFYNNWSTPHHLEIRTQLSNGDGTWTSKGYNLSDGPGVLDGRFFLADVNGDGKADLVYVFYNNWSTPHQLEIRTQLSNGDGTWTSKGHNLSDGPGVLFGKFFVGDANGDGRADLVYVFYNDWSTPHHLEIRTQLSNGDGTWTSKGHNLSDGPGVLHGKFLFGDINSDGRADLVYVFYNDWAATKHVEIRTQLSRGHGTWDSKGQNLADGPGVLQGKFFLGDVNNDRRQDVVYTFFNNWSNPNGLEIRTLISKGDGTWDSAGRKFTDGRGVLKDVVLMADTTGDKRSDIVYSFVRDWPRTP